MRSDTLPDTLPDTLSDIKSDTFTNIISHGWTYRETNIASHY